MEQSIVQHERMEQSPCFMIATECRAAAADAPRGP
jgi:hypothetical protein